MADPTAYNVSYSFSGFQATNPDDPLPGASLDTELANVETSLDSLVAAVTGIRRSDGALQNAVVTYDSLTDDMKNLIDGAESVSVGDLDPAAFASQTEAETGTANDKIMTPLRSKQALDALRALASQSEAQAGTNNTKVMTPLRTKEAIDSQRGLATQAEAEAGTNNTKVLTPLRAAQEIDAKRPALTTTATLTFGSIAAAGAISQTVTLTGAIANDGVVLGLPAAGLPSGVIAEAWISAADTVTIRLTNITGASITPTASQTYRVTAIRF